MKFKQIISALLLLCAATFSAAQSGVLPSASCTVTDRYYNPLRNIISGKDNFLLPVNLNDVSPYFVLAVLAAEDKRFFEHGGVDLQSVARAAWQNFSAGQVVSGASTITQQLVSASKPKEKTITAKIKQALGAVKLEGKLTKQQILEAYFNTVNLGGNIYGVEAAAKIYFNNNAAGLSLSQSAFLAGIIKSPVRYNPRKNFSAALKRRDFILEQMFKNGFINGELYRAALTEKIILSSSPAPFAAPHYAEFISKTYPCTGRVKTTIDGNIQLYIEKLVPEYLKKLEKNKVSNAAVIVLDNATGDVLAFVGSADYFDEKAQGFVNGVLALRQPGSALKPFVYAAAFENDFLPSDKIKDEDTFFEGGFRPKNYDEEYHGDVTLRQALGCSYNIPAVAVAQKIGVGRVLETLRKVGFTTLTKPAQDYGLGIALGNGEVSLLELANAYRALANGGVWMPVRFTLEPAAAQSGAAHRAISAQAAFMTTDILADNAARSSAFGLNSPLNLPFSFAAKTGTSKDYRDNIAAGYNRRFTAAVWTGNFNGEPMRKVSGITGAAPLLKDIFMFLQDKYPQEQAKNNNSFDRPQTVLVEEVCAQSGLLAGKDCPLKITEVFPLGKLPKPCNLTKAQHGGEALDSKAAEGIIFPADGDIFKADPAVPQASQQLLFKADAQGKWFVNGKEYNCNSQKCFWPLTVGKFNLKLVTPAKTYQVNFTVLR